jgi:hypothetical protein
MVGKQISGKGFGGCIRYLLERDKALLLEVHGVRMQSIQAMVQDFHIQRGMNPNLAKAVGHLVLSWSREDKPLLTSNIMAERAREYLKMMNIENTQYIIVQHTDREHPHVHIVYNRVNNSGKTISDSNNYKRNIKACKEITLKYGYHIGEGKEKVKRERLKGKEQIRYELYDAISKAEKTAAGWQQLEAKLKSQGIEIQFKYRSGTKEVQGISFSKGELKMKGSAIDRDFSYSKLNTKLESNRGEQQRDHEQFVQQLRDAVASSNTNTAEYGNEPEYLPEFEATSAGMFPDFLEDLSQAASGSADNDDARKRKKRNYNGYSR